MMIEVWHVLKNILKAVDDSGYIPLLITAVFFFQIGKKAMLQYPQIQSTGFAAGLVSFCGYFVWKYDRIGVPLDVETPMKAFCLATATTGVAWMILALATFFYRSGPGSALKTLLRRRDS